MSRDNVELHRRFVEAFNARDVERLITLCDQQVEFHSLLAAVGDTVYRGHEIRRWHRDLEDGERRFGSSLRCSSTSASTRSRSTCSTGADAKSGAEVAMPYAQVMRWRNDLVIYFKAHAHREDALRELGVSEDELERIDP